MMPPSSCLFMPKLLLLLQDLTCCKQIDNFATVTLSEILDVKLDAPMKAKVSLPPKNGGFGICSADFLALSAFWPPCMPLIRPTKQSLTPGTSTPMSPNRLPFLSGSLKVSLQTSSNETKQFKSLGMHPITQRRSTLSTLL